MEEFESKPVREKKMFSVVPVIGTRKQSILQQDKAA